MKKIFALALALVMSVSLVACGNGGDKSGGRQRQHGRGDEKSLHVLLLNGVKGS